MFTDNNKLVNNEKEKEFLWIFNVCNDDETIEPASLVTVEGNCAKVREEQFNKSVVKFDVPLLSYEVEDWQLVKIHFLHISQDWVLHTREGLQFLLWLQYKEMINWQKDIKENFGTDDVFNNYAFCRFAYNDNDAICGIRFESKDAHFGMVFSIPPYYEVEYDDWEFLKILFSSIELQIVCKNKGEIYKKEVKEFVENRFMHLRNRFLSSYPFDSNACAINDMFDCDFLNIDMVDQCDEFALHNVEYFGDSYTIEYPEGPTPAVHINVFRKDFDVTEYNRMEWEFHDATITLQDETIDEKTIMSEIKHICKRKRIKLI